jgi:hypothetical protein
LEVAPIPAKSKLFQPSAKRSIKQADAEAKVKDETDQRLNPTLRRFISSAVPRLLIQLSFIITLPVILSRRLWQEIWSGVRSHAWDGTGHSAVAQIYNQSIFPDTLGWTHAFFGGMPLPNFYPPLFYWLVALLAHTHLFSLTTAFKLIVIIPVLLMPVALWLLGWTVSSKSYLLACMVALASVPLLSDARFTFVLPAGLDYFSTFQIGLYTQPLGFVLLIAWYVCYSSTRQRRWPFILASLLLALTVLANFFNAMTAAIFIAATLIGDAINCRRALSSGQKKETRQRLLVHLASPLISACLTAFWLVPMLGQYQYFVTRPFVIDTRLLVTPAFWIWYLLAIIGSVFW